MEGFTRAQLEAAVKFKEVDPYDSCSAVAEFALSKCDEVEALLIQLDDLEEDFETLNLEAEQLRSKLASAEAERDILQWASDHAGGGGSCDTSAASKQGGCCEHGVSWQTYCHKCNEKVAAENAERSGYFAGELLVCDGRPHEALVWALFYSDGISIGAADAMLEAWRDRWPEPKA